MLRLLFRRLPRGLKYALKSADAKWRARQRYRAAYENLVSNAEQVSESAATRNAASEGPMRADARDALRKRFLYMLGLDQELPRPSMPARVTGVVDRPDYNISKLIFEPLPKLYIAANYYLPKDRKGPLPCILYLCGHQIHPFGAKTQYQNRFLWYPENGFACLVMDSLQCGEIPGVHRGPLSIGMLNWLSLGYTPAGIEVWSAMRALDWLESESSVDASRIGVTGASGGGVMTWFLAAADERVKVAAPSASAYTLGSQARNVYIDGQCDCTFYSNQYCIDFPEIMELIAPRPLLMLCGKRDYIFPPQGYRAVYNHLSRIYANYARGGHKSRRIELAECNNGHSDSPESLKRTHAWMQRWLCSETVSNQDIKPLRAHIVPADDLVCLDSLPKDAVNYSIHRTFIDSHMPSVPKKAEEWRNRRDTVMRFLRKGPFGWFPEKITAHSHTKLSNGTEQSRRFSNVTEWTLETEPGVNIVVHLFQPWSISTASLLTVIKHDSRPFFPDDELLPLLSTHSLLIIEPRFVEADLNRKSRSRIERIAALSGRTIASIQVWDVLCALKWVHSQHDANYISTSIFGRDEAAVIAVYAALFDDRVQHVVVHNPPATHMENPPIFNVLRETDFIEVVGFLAPRKLTILGAWPVNFDLTRKTYSLLGHSSACNESRSLFEAIHRDHAAF